MKRGVIDEQNEGSFVLDSFLYQRDPSLRKFCKTLILEPVLEKSGVQDDIIFGFCIIEFEKFLHIFLLFEKIMI